MLVKDFYKGPTRIRIYDDSCCSKEDAQEILKRIGENVYLELCANEQKKEKTA